MEKTINKFKELVKRKGSISSPNANEAIEILYNWYQQTLDTKQLCEYLLEASYIVIGKFINKYSAVMSAQELTAICSEFTKQLDNQQIKISLPCGFAFVANSINVCNDGVLHVLNKTISYAAKKDGFAKAKCEAMKKHLLEPTKGMILTVDYSNWDKDNIAHFAKYLTATLGNFPDIKCAKQINSWLHDYTNQAMPTAQPAVSAPVACLITTEIIAELQLLYHNAFIKNNAFKELEEQIIIKELALTAMEQKHAELVAQAQPLEDEIRQKSAQISELDERLTKFFSLDDIAKKQELSGLKSEISYALKPTYNNYCGAINQPLSQNSYDFYKALLNKVFKTLKRFDIEL